MGEERTNTRALSADEILAAEDIELREVEVPEWRGTVRLRVLPADEGLALSAQMAALDKEHQSDALFMLLGACLVGADGRPMFTTDEHRKKLRTRSQKVLLRLQRDALALQGWGEDAKAGKGA